eukprot:CAMPEP_0202891048 /NCGR_PEP_ID=MMETSP1392-20130828/1236_1 /ASSEMBLY_ACC=CAM_ASM_000868 /TAXON_ID=225041 /ORGANISM="Chlamydomonas chlamydogama, Strain SAG 11-48b" /LENGTH=407 /DNA_ID=CAMNT_0049574713 /DNA_START=373 /DNA_END=1596 /DNA_ORIENTATION=-
MHVLWLKCGEVALQFPIRADNKFKLRGDGSVCEEFRLGAGNVKINGIPVPCSADGWTEMTVQELGFVGTTAQAPLPVTGAVAGPSTSVLPGAIEGKLDTIIQLVKPLSEASRSASTMKLSDLEALESALQVSFVVWEDEDITDHEVLESLRDPTEFQWDENKHEARHAKEYVQVLSNKVALPSHLKWSPNVNKSHILRTGMHAGGASLPFGIAARTDAMVVAARSRLIEEASIVATVEMKKKVVQQSRRQTKATYLCASLKSQLPVISVVTDMDKVAVAYYTSGQRLPNGMTVITERVFSHVDGMMAFLHSALSSESIASNVLRPRGDDFVIPEELPNPKRVKLPVPARASNAAEVRQLLAALAGDDGDDIANLRDVEGMLPCEQPYGFDLEYTQVGTAQRPCSYIN